MPQPPKEKPCEEEETSDLADDQRERGYYYDDAHGYEDFEPDGVDEDEEEEDEVEDERTTPSVPSKDDGTATPPS